MKILLLIPFIFISISLKTSTILESKSQVFERSDCTITVRNDFYYNELKLSRDIIQNQKIVSRKNTN